MNPLGQSGDMIAKLLEDWLTANRARIDAHELVATRSENWASSSQEGVWLDLEGGCAWGRVTFWPNGRADMEVLDVATTLAVASWHGLALESAQLEEWLTALETANVR
jgi:hypothetical protein